MPSPLPDLRKKILAGEEITPAELRQAIQYQIDCRKEAVDRLALKVKPSSISSLPSQPKPVTPIQTKLKEANEAIAAKKVHKARLEALLSSLNEEVQEVSTPVA